MIKGLHGIFYTPKADEVREFIREKLDFTYTDTGEGWLIFDMPEADLGVHPSDNVSHSISFYCDDIQKTVEELKSRGVQFTTGVADQGWGLLTHFRMPGELEVELYQPRYEKRVHSKSRKTRTRRKSASKKRKDGRY